MLMKKKLNIKAIIKDIATRIIQGWIAQTAFCICLDNGWLFGTQTIVSKESYLALFIALCVTILMATFCSVIMGNYCISKTDAKHTVHSGTDWKQKPKNIWQNTGRQEEH